MPHIDLNCDMGEGIGNEESLMPFISSANIACGYHAGDDDEMKRVVELCMKYNVAIGAHPSFDDKPNFGRTEMYLPAEEIYQLIQRQIQTLNRIVITNGGKLHHVKPHGALYNMAAKDRLIANAIAKAVKDTDAGLIFYGLSGAVMIDEANQLGLQTANEVFADRTYQANGYLTPRTKPNALITDTAVAIQEVLEMVLHKKITATNGSSIAVNADTVCIHGDGTHAAEFARALHNSLQNAGITIQKIHS